MPAVRPAASKAVNEAAAVETVADQSLIPMVELRDLGKIHRSGRLEVEAIRNANLRVLPGEYVAVIGPSGSGKSTLLTMVGCLDRPTSGSCLLAGIDVAGMDDDELAQIRNERIGFVFQSYNLLGGSTALENVELPLIYSGVPRSERIARATRMLERVGLGDRMDHAPSELSGGQQQRVAIARALVTKPDLLLADEPTGNLDSVSGEDVLNLFDELNADGTCIVMITHEHDVARRAGRQLVIRDGVLDELDHELEDSP
jgi:putative ABC transport system ATP-binding protein